MLLARVSRASRAIESDQMCCRRWGQENVYVIHHVFELHVSGPGRRLTVLCFKTPVGVADYKWLPNVKRESIAWEMSGHETEAAELH